MGEKPFRSPLLRDNDGNLMLTVFRLWRKVSLMIKPGIGQLINLFNKFDCKN